MGAVNSSRELEEQSGLGFGFGFGVGVGVGVGSGRNFNLPKRFSLPSQIENHSPKSRLGRGVGGKKNIVQFKVKLAREDTSKSKRIHQTRCGRVTRKAYTDPKAFVGRITDDALQGGYKASMAGGRVDAAAPLLARIATGLQYDSLPR